MISRVLLAIAIAALLSACLARSLRTRQLTGTCEGACDHYLGCKDARGDDAARSCVSECRDVFSDQDSLRAFESLSCADAIEYVEGQQAVTSSR